MGKGITIFGQLQAWLPRAAFAAAVRQQAGDYKVHVATCWSHAQCLFLALLLHRQSLRDIMVSLHSRLTYLRQFGLGSVDRSTVSHANAHRPAAVMETVVSTLLLAARRAAPRHPFRFRGPLLSLDGSVITVSHTLFAWARCAATEAGVKLHLLLDHAGLVPRLLEIRTLRDGELAVARGLPFAAGTVLCFDRGYFDTAWFATLMARGVSFVTRLQSARVHYQIVRGLPVPPGTGLVADQLIRFTGATARANYPWRLRLVTVEDPTTGTRYLILTNQLTWAALTISQIYKSRWQIELFFKWVKQHLKVITFYGRDENAVRWQLLTAIALYLLFALLRFQSRHERSLLTIQRLIETHLFDPVDWNELLDFDYQFQT